MRNLPREKLLKILGLLLNPVIRFCIRKGLRFQDFSDIAKTVYLESAKTEIECLGEKVTSSRLSTMTGLQRRETAKVPTSQTQQSKERDIIIKIVGLWQTGSDFITKARDPRVLTYIGESSEFSQLVKRVSKDINSATVLFELERLGIVEKSERGIRLRLDTVSPRTDVEGGLQILGNDIRDITSAVEENLLGENEIANLHVRTYFDNVRADALPEIKQWLLKEGHAFHAKARDFIAAHDQDINPKLNHKGRKITVSVSSFGFSENKK